MKPILILCLLASATPSLAAGSIRMRGYVTKRGAYVAPHYQTRQNQTKLDNYSTKGNVNPYTGRRGTVDPYKPTPKWRVR